MAAISSKMLNVTVNTGQNSL